MNKDISGHVTLIDFIDAFIKGEIFLAKKIDTA